MNGRSVVRANLKSKIDGNLRKTDGSLPTYDLSVNCDLYDAPACLGGHKGFLQDIYPEWSGSPDWQSIDFNLGMVDEQVQSMECLIHVNGNDPTQSELKLDALKLNVTSDLIFLDGFE